MQSTKSDTPPKQNYLLEGGPLLYRLPPLGEYSRNPSVSVFSWHCCERLHSASVNFLKLFQRFAHFIMGDSWAHLPHHTECWALFDQKRMTLVPHPPYSPDFAEWHFFSPWKKKVLKGKHCANVEVGVRGETKIRRSTKRYQNQQVPKLFQAVEKTSH